MKYRVRLAFTVLSALAFNASRSVANSQQPSAPGGQQPEEIVIGVVVLSELPSGKQVSGRVVENPEKYQQVPGLRVVQAKVAKPSQTTTSGSTTVLKGVVADVGDGKKRDADKALTWIPVVGQTATIISLFLRDQPGKPLIQESVPVVAEKPGGGSSTGGNPAGRSAQPTGRPTTPSSPTSPPRPEAPPTSVPSDRPGNPGGSQPVETGTPELTTPAAATPGAVSVVHGNTSGNADEMSVHVDDIPATIVAAKPGTFFWEVPENLTHGEHHVRIVPGHAMRPVTLPLYIVTLEMSVDRTNLLRGQSTRLHVVVKGLDKLPAHFWEHMQAPPSDLVSIQRLQSLREFGGMSPSEEGTLVLLLENGSMGTITMGKGNVVVLKLHKKDFEKGAFTYEDKIQSLQSGNFTISGTVTVFLKQQTSIGEMR